MLRSNHERVIRENLTLRDALREANKGLLKHRNLINSLREGRFDVTKMLEKVLNK